jgi:hypothetical protein
MHKSGGIAPPKNDQIVTLLMFVIRGRRQLFRRL